jgi:hypothetical protein
MQVPLPLESYSSPDRPVERAGRGRRLPAQTREIATLANFSKEVGIMGGVRLRVSVLNSFVFSLRTTVRGIRPFCPEAVHTFSASLRTSGAVSPGAPSFAHHLADGRKPEVHGRRERAATPARYSAAALGRKAACHRRRTGRPAPWRRCAGDGPTEPRIQHHLPQQSLGRVRTSDTPFGASTTWRTISFALLTIA